MTQIKSIYAREILDSRGYPTIETTVQLVNGITIASSIPSGASTGTHEAVELRDNDPNRFRGKGVLKAVNHVNSAIADTLIGQDVTNQEKLDDLMVILDGTPNKSKLGANAILSVSQACLKAAALSKKQPLYRYIANKYKLLKKLTMPQPTFNVLNGGKHGNGKLEFQEFHIIPSSKQPFNKMLESGVEFYLALEEILKSSELYQGIGDEGGFTGNFATNQQALAMLLKTADTLKLKFNRDIYLGLDVAATEFYDTNKYFISDKLHHLTREELLRYYLDLYKQYPFIYLEDGLEEDDWDGWQQMYKKFSKKQILIVGDDFLTTNPKRVKEAILQRSCNAILVKPNQIGTITEVVEVLKLAKQAKWVVVMSHRSGETNDTFISDFAVGVGADMVKFGSPARGERIAKYNRLMEIEQDIRDKS